jgi:hypothetical protein
MWQDLKKQRLRERMEHFQIFFFPGGLNVEFKVKVNIREAGVVLEVLQGFLVRLMALNPVIICGRYLLQT